MGAYFHAGPALVCTYSFYVPSGAGDEDNDEQEGEEDWTTDDGEMDEAEQIEKAKSMAAVLKSSKGQTLIFVSPARQELAFHP